MTTPVFPDGQYDHSSSWTNANDRVMWERTFATGTESSKLMAVAAITADMSTPSGEIRAKLCAPPAPAPCAPVKTSPTLDDVLAMGSQPDYGHMYDRSPTDFSQSNGSYSGTARPSLPGF